MGGHHRGAGRGGHGQVLGVGEAADVVAHHGAGGEAGAGHRRPPRVDRQGHVEAGGEGLDGGHDPVELLLLADLVAGPGLHPADVEEVGAGGDQGGGLAQEGVEVPVGAAVVERVRCAVEDAHHEGPVLDGETAVAEPQLARVDRCRQGSSATPRDRTAEGAPDDATPALGGPDVHDQPLAVGPRRARRSPANSGPAQPRGRRRRDGTGRRVRSRPAGPSRSASTRDHAGRAPARGAGSPRRRGVRIAGRPQARQDTTGVGPAVDHDHRGAGVGQPQLGAGTEGDPGPAPPGSARRAAARTRPASTQSRPQRPAAAGPEPVRPRRRRGRRPPARRRGRRRGARQAAWRTARAHAGHPPQQHRVGRWITRGHRTTQHAGDEPCRSGPTP